MKKILIIFSILIIFVFSTFACSSPNGAEPGIENGNDVASSPVTESNLNDLRTVAGRGWGYALVAGDCVFTEEGYYKFSDILEYRLYRDGVTLGKPDERDVFFARGEKSVYGVYRAKKGDYYAFSADYADPRVRYAKIEVTGVSDMEEAFMGQGGDETKLFIIGSKLYAYDFGKMITLAETDVNAEEFSDFGFYQKGSSAVAVNASPVKIYVYDGDAQAFSTVTAGEGFSLPDGCVPAEIDGTYFFGKEEGQYISLTGGEVSADTVEKYADYIAASDKAVSSQGEFTVGVENGEAVLKENGETVAEFTGGIIANNVPEVAAMEDRRKGEEGALSVVSAEFLYGKLFLVIEKEPVSKFVGLRNLNEGIPQTVVSYELDGSGRFSFCGMIDFTWFSIYKIVKL